MPDFLPALMMALATTASAVPTDNPQVSPLDRAVQSAADTFFKDGCHVGVSLAVYDHGKAAFYDYGSTTKTAAHLPTPQSLYEIASITKTFTGVVAARALLDGKMTLDGDFRTYLKTPYPNLEMNGKPITLRTLATHTSGLARDIPDSSDLFAGHPDFDTLPYQLITREKAYDETRYLQDLHDVALASEPGSRMVYSNFGIKLLSFGLENVYAAPFDKLVARTITQPLGMPHTGFDVAPADAPRLVQGYGPGGKPMPYHLGNAGAAGGLYSSTEDLVKYAAWHVAEADPVVRQSHAIVRGDIKSYAIGLIWDEATTATGERKLWHSGGGYGMSSQLILFPDMQQAYVLLANDGCFDSQKELDEMAMAIHAAR